jgi:FMN phosphatase YigB (HAD superfamily)
MPRIKNQYLAPRTSIIKIIQALIWRTSTNQIPLAAQSTKTSIIFDLDGVLCTTNTLQAFREIGILLTFQYIFEQWKIPSQNELYKIIMSTPAKSKVQSFITDTLRMPQIVVDWQCGLQSTHDLQNAMIQNINNANLTHIQKKFWIKAIILQTTPEMLIASRCIIPGAVQLLHDLKYAGYKIYIISNWDLVSFPLFKKNFPKIFTFNNKKMFDGIMTSGKAGIVKPHHTIFEKSLIEFNIQATDALFIDDVIENVQAAQKFGISSIHCIKQNLKYVRKHLINILKSSK